MTESFPRTEAANAVPHPRNRRYPVLTIIFALIAIIAIAAALYFWRERQTALVELSAARARATRAEQNFKSSDGAVDAFVSSLADTLGNPADLQAHAFVPLLDKVEGIFQTLATQTENDRDVRRSQAAMYVQLSATYLGLGDPKRAVASARKGTDIFRALAAAQPGDKEIQSNVGLSLQKLGQTLRASGDNNAALTAERDSLDIARALADTNPGNKQFQIDLVLELWRLASSADNPRELLTEAIRILKNLKLAGMLTPDQEQWIGMIEGDLGKIR